MKIITYQGRADVLRTASGRRAPHGAAVEVTDDDADRLASHPHVTVHEQPDSEESNDES